MVSMPDDQNPELPLTPPPPGDGSPGALHIQPVNIEDEMRKSYLDYSMSVIIGRALPDVRDGLKPVHRRILYTMQQMGLQPNRATRKCARIVGDVMGKYHPHGNLAVYDASSPLSANLEPPLSANLRTRKFRLRRRRPSRRRSLHRSQTSRSLHRSAGRLR